MKHGIRWACAITALFGALAGRGEPILIDHRQTDITQLTEAEIKLAKSVLHIAYGHTSHGSQLTDGMTGLVDFANGGGRGLALPRDIFAWNDGGADGALDLHDYAMEGDVGYYPDWVDNTRRYLNSASHADVNVVAWSWCGQMDDKYSAGTLSREYLQPMAALERDYPNVVFIYMTGHVDIWDDAANKAACRAIRDWCATGDRVLFDFNDIEHYDPAGTYYPYVNDDCGVYDRAGGTQIGNWATEWQNAHVEGVDWYRCNSEHSEPLNANRKAYAAWALWCQLAARFRAPTSVLSVAPARRVMGRAGGRTSFVVSIRGEEGTTYGAKETSAWLRITSGLSGGDGGTIRVACRANPGPGARTGTIAIRCATARTKTAKIVQGGRRLPLLAVSPANRAVADSGGRATFTVANKGGGRMTYRARRSATWLHLVKGARGTGRGSIVVSCDPNSSTQARTGTVTVTASGVKLSPTRVKVIQAGRPANP